MAKNFEDVAWYSEMLCPDVNGMGKLAMSERVHAEGLKVVLTGSPPLQPASLLHHIQLTLNHRRRLRRALHRLPLVLRRHAP